MISVSYQKNFWHQIGIYSVCMLHLHLRELILGFVKEMVLWSSEGSLLHIFFIKVSNLALFVFFVCLWCTTLFFSHKRIKSTNLLDMLGNRHLAMSCNHRNSKLELRKLNRNSPIPSKFALMIA